MGESFEWGGMKLEVIDMDGLRVDKLLVKKTGQESLANDDL